ncbi:MAG: M64 family metallopeptidase [Phaeodactylibacter sp.]|uniref:T9SS type A sorting domain-containing protein n=1 Tax=Phaeodactylibacter sp. TaxID=1940289 RepID=UPI0032EF7167
MKNTPLILFLLACLPHFAAAQCAFTEVHITTVTAEWGAEVSWELLDESENPQASFQADADNSTYDTTLCLPDACYLLHARDSYGDGWNGGTVSIAIGGEVLNYTLEEGEEGFFAFGVNTSGCEVEIPGCTDPDAVNYNPLATIDDDSCMSIPEILEQQSITMLLESGPKDNRINWAIQNRGMPNPGNAFVDEAQFVGLLQDSLLPTFTPGSVLEKEPYARYRNFFNLSAWWWPDAPSQETGWSWAILKGIRDLHFLPWADEEHGWATLFSISRTGGGGGAGLQPETRTGDGLMFGVGWETLLHEFGHTMPQVPDEYTSSGEWSGGNCWESANTTRFTIQDSIPWRKWIEPETQLPTPYVGDNLDKIGAFEGALTNYFGCHRPTARGCYMGAGGFGWGYGQDLCPPCRQRVVCHLYKYVDVIESPVPASPQLEVTGTTTLSFSADIVKPEPNTQVYTWLLNGKVIAQGTEAVNVTFGSCDTYELTLTVEDTTSWVRYDAHFDDIYPRPFESHTWYIEQTDVDSYDLLATPFATDTDCSGMDNGSIGFNFSGGEGPYEVFWNGSSVGTAHTGLAPGFYEYWAADGNGCGVEASANIEASPVLSVDLCTAYDEDWSATVSTSGYPSEDLSYQWSTGDSAAEVTGLSDGTYTVSVTTPDGCTVEKDINLDAPQEPLSVSAEYFTSSSEGNTGAIYLTITGGRPDYEIAWYEKTVQDLTATGGTPTASGYNFGHLPEYAFDDDPFTKWLQLGEADVWLSYYFPEGRRVQSYSVMSGDDVPGRDPAAWRLEGSMNGMDWETLDTRQGIDFPQRRQQKAFQTTNEAVYLYYRFYITANSGADAIQLQELEFIGLDPDEVWQYNPAAGNQTVRRGLSAGAYRYQVKDQNQSCTEADFLIETAATFVAANLHVVQENSCQVAIEAPQPGIDYYWLADEGASEILAIGPTFQPPAPGNYWIAAVQQATGLMSSNRPGFSVTMPVQPVVSEVEEGILGVEDADPDLIYFWYTQSCGDTPVHEGTTFAPGPEPRDYWVAAWWAAPFPEPMDPMQIPGLIVRMDASDLDGNGQMDDPAPVSSSLYEWAFTPENGWSDGSWFALRGNQQNGLGIADFATIWFQCIQEGFSGYQTVVMAYEENALSWRGSAPFFGLSNVMPYSAMPAEQLYAETTPASTLNGQTYLNGKAVDPMATANPMDFCVLAQSFTEPVGWTDCTDTHWEGSIGELLFYEEPLDEEQLSGLSEYLRRKWISTADLESRRTGVSWDGMNTRTVEPESDFALQVSPNPVTDHATLLIKEGSNQGVMEIYLHDAMGRILQQAPLEAGQQTFRLDNWLKPLQSGLYFITVRSQSGRQRNISLMKS